MINYLHQQTDGMNYGVLIWALADTDKAQEYFSSTCAPEAGDSKAHAYHFIKSLRKLEVLTRHYK